MRIFSCKIMRATVLVSALLFGFGVLTRIPAAVVWLQPLFPPAYLSYLGLMAMLSSPALLIVAVLVSSLPGVNQKLRSCQH